MEAEKNMLDIDYASNDQLKSLFGSKNIGDSCELKLHLTVVSKNEDGIKLSVRKVVTEKKEYNGDDIMPDSDQPVMMTMKARMQRSFKGPPQPVQNSAGTTSYA